MLERSVQLLIIGGGPAGYAAAARGRQLGLDTILVERDTLGGTCLNRGCIPTKTLLESAGLFQQIKKAQEFGLSINEVDVQYDRIVERKDRIVDSLVKGLQHTMEQSGVEVVPGEAVFVGSNQVRVDGPSPTTIQAEKIITATGTTPAHLPHCRPNGENIFDSDSILRMTHLPSSLVIVGGGVIGCEFASIFQALGVSVTIVELLDGLLPGEDGDLRKTLLREFKKQKIKVLTEARLNAVVEEQGSLKFSIEQKGKERELEAAACLIAIGRRPVVPDGLDVDKDEAGYIVVNENYETSQAPVYAAGDLIGGLQLAHLAFFEGINAVNAAFGAESRRSWHVPRCVYTHPETAAVGLTEEQARQQYEDVQIGTFSLKGNGKAMILGDNAGFCKVIAEPDGRVLGFHMVGPHATEMIAEAVVALEQGLSLAEWSQCIHPHPTVNESIQESLWSALGVPLHG